MEPDALFENLECILGTLTPPIKHVPFLTLVRSETTQNFFGELPDPRAQDASFSPEIVPRNDSANLEPELSNDYTAAEPEPPHDDAIAKTIILQASDQAEDSSLSLTTLSSYYFNGST